jgi:small subunit ribosomal protein S3
MIERDFIAQKTKEHYIQKYIESKLDKVGISSIRLKKIPLGEKIIIATSRPSLIVGSKGSNIKELTKVLKKEFKLENPQIEINEVKNIWLDANIVAERIAGSLERFGSARFKGIGHKTMENVMRSGAMGVEIVISGKVPSTRAKTWRFSNGYLKKCGDIAIVGVKKAQTKALLKSGILGIKVAIMPPDLILPDHVEILAEPEQVVEETKTEEKEEKVKKTTTKKKTVAKKKTTKKKSAGKEKKESITEKVKDVIEKIEEKAEEIVEEVVEKVEEVLHIKNDEKDKKEHHHQKTEKPHTEVKKE